MKEKILKFNSLNDMKKYLDKHMNLIFLIDGLNLIVYDI